MQTSEAPQNATLLPAGILSKATANSSSAVGSIVAFETGNGTSSASGLRSMRSTSLSFARTVMNSPIEIRLITRVCTAVGFVPTSQRVGFGGSNGMLSLYSGPAGRLIRHIEYIGT